MQLRTSDGSIRMIDELEAMCNANSCNFIASYFRRIRNLDSCTLKKEM